VERNHSLYFVNQLYALQNGQNHGLSKQNLRKFQIRCKFAHFVFMKCFNYTMCFLLIGVILIFYIIIYIRQDYEFYFIINLMFLLLAAFTAIKMVATIALTIFIIYSTALYLRLNFQQITKQFQTITVKNFNLVKVLIRDHNRVTVMTNDCNMFFSKFFGVIYFYAPVIFNLFLCIIIYGESSIYVRAIHAALAVGSFGIFYLITYIPTQVSSEAHRCYRTINSLNARINFPLQTKFKVRLFLKQNYLIFFNFFYS